MAKPLETLSVRVDRDQCSAILHLDGELDLANVDLADQAISETAADIFSRHLMVDCQQLTFIDSSGIRALISAHQQWEGKLAVLHPHRIVEKAIAVTGLTEVLHVVESVEEAREILHS
ncbi:MAG: anti-sigma factor antagonist [Acidimicrobiia bacterium]|nr:anti-sigma factor antagonist [Acidimicrobiia bacterium]